jgi:hypothetical protein
MLVVNMGVQRVGRQLWRPSWLSDMMDDECDAVTIDLRLRRGG